MNFPPELPEGLKTLAVFTSGTGMPAWSGKDALAVLDALSGTGIAIQDGEVYRLQVDGLVSAHEGWTCQHAEGEPATDYAERSRAMARRFVEGRSPDGDDLFFLFRFSRQQDAA